MNGESSNGFSAKIKIKRKRLPSSPITVRIHAAQDNATTPEGAEKEVFSMPSSPRPKIENAIKTPSGRRGSYK